MDCIPAKDLLQRLHSIDSAVVQSVSKEWLSVWPTDTHMSRSTSSQHSFTDLQEKDSVYIRFGCARIRAAKVRANWHHILCSSGTNPSSTFKNGHRSSALATSFVFSCIVLRWSCAMDRTLKMQFLIFLCVSISCCAWSKVVSDEQKLCIWLTISPTPPSPFSVALFGMCMFRCECMSTCHALHVHPKTYHILRDFKFITKSLVKLLRISY